MGWIKNAIRRGDLAISERLACPYCNTTEEDEITSLHACEFHHWVNKQWFEGKFNPKGTIRKRNRKPNRVKPSFTD